MFQYMYNIQYVYIVYVYINGKRENFIIIFLILELFWSSN